MFVSQINKIIDNYRNYSLSKGVAVHPKSNGGSEFESKIGYSRAVVDGDYVFVSGTTGYDYNSMSISENPVEQADQCFKNDEIKN